MGSVGRGVAKRGTGEVASISAGFRMMGRVMGGTPTCSGEVRGCRISGGWVSGGGPSGAGLSRLGLEATGDPVELLLVVRLLSGFSEAERRAKVGVVKLSGWHEAALKPLSGFTNLCSSLLLS